MLNSLYYNPGNLRPTYDAAGKELLFLGQNPTPAGIHYRQFVDIAHGYRALCRQLEEYFAAGKNTIRKISNRLRAFPKMEMPQMVAKK